MSSPTAISPDAPPKKRYKMQLRQVECMVTPTGTQRYPAGAVLVVDEDTAARWYENSIADIADPSAEAFADVARRAKREEFARRAQAVETGTFDQMVTRGPSAQDGPDRQVMPPPMPVPQRRRSRRDLEGADIVNAPDDED